MKRQRFELLILGSSSASPTSERNPSAQLLNVAERYFLIDCGEATQIQLRKNKAKFQAIDHILISHLHGDHFFGLPGLLSSMHLLGRKNALRIYAPERLKKILELMLDAGDTRLNYELIWHFTSDDDKHLLFEDTKLRVFSFPLKHRIFCTGFLFEEKTLPRNIDKYKIEKFKVSFADIQNLKNGKDVTNEHGELILNSSVTIDPLPPRSYAYCSDTIYHESIVKYIEKVNLLYHESTFLEDKKDRAKKTFHSTATDAARIAKLAKVDKLLLGHFSARYGHLEEFLNEASTAFQNCELALEGKTFTLS
ncbi:MAG: ribonuclease Z [Bacteroidota bacterium]|jgi:ribonuclease Z|nr:ribonuclease Z [Bacteroidota bacterium]MCA6445240.1 ribonuclease Z [Bacteroidota bacterium]